MGDRVTRHLLWCVCGVAWQRGWLDTCSVLSVQMQHESPAVLSSAAAVASCSCLKWSASPLSQGPSSSKSGFRIGEMVRPTCIFKVSPAKMVLRICKREQKLLFVRLRSWRRMMQLTGRNSCLLDRTFAHVSLISVLTGERLGTSL